MKKIKFDPSGICLSADDNDSIFEAVLKNGFVMRGECGGKGTCGKCRCLANGREELACRHIPAHDSIISADIFLNGESLSLCHRKLDYAVSPFIHTESFSIEIGEFRDYMSSFKACFPDSAEPDLEFLRQLSLLTGRTGSVSVLFAGKRPVSVCPDGGRISVGIVDIGTTAVKCLLADLNEGTVKAEASALNAQRRYGTDLISRIIASKDNLEDMSACIWNSVKSLFLKMASESGLPFPSILLIAGNTVMSSLFCGISPDSIRRIPGGPVSASFPFIRKEQVACCLVPAVSGFVGGDVVSGCVNVGLCREQEPSMLIDLGTNGEIALGCSDWIGVCSASAGPAFEGGGIKCGMIALDGAVFHASVSADGVDLSVIGGGKPLGLCSSGVISLIAGLFRNGMIDRSGRFTERSSAVNGRLFLAEGKNGDIFIDEDDIANLLRAKAAIFAGAESLLASFGMSFSDLKNVYIAGSVSEHCMIDDCFEIGLFPPVCRDKIVIVGNSSLAGCLDILLDSERWIESEKISENALFVDLASEASFMDRWGAALFIPHTDDIYGELI